MSESSPEQERIQLFLKTVLLRINEVMDLKNRTTPIQGTSQLSKESDNLGVYHRNETNVDMMEAMKVPLQIFLQDVWEAKAILTDIFQKFSRQRDLDLKAGFEEMRADVFNEIQDLENSIHATFASFLEYHQVRMVRVTERDLNSKVEDLKYAVYMLDYTVQLHNVTTLAQVISGYFSLREAVNETFELLQIPGCIGKRCAVIKALRNNLYA